MLPCQGSYAHTRFSIFPIYHIYDAVYIHPTYYQHIIRGMCSLAVGKLTALSCPNRQRDLFSSFLSPSRSVDVFSPEAQIGWLYERWSVLCALRELVESQKYYI